MMKSNRIIVLIKLLMFFLLFLIHGRIPLASAADGPMIHIDPTTHTFLKVFEGEILSHDFVVSNRGSADLEINDVTHQ
jgi:hypothetical protein